MSLVSHYREAISPEVIRQADGKFTLKRIPIFECHDREDIHCNDAWMYACVADQQTKKANGFRPRLIIGHTSDNPRDPEKPVKAFLDNYSFDAATKWLYADYVDVPQELLEQLKRNEWPGRSAEASRSRPAIDTVALLGGTPPYFKLPDVKYDGKTADTVSIFSECLMATKLSDENMRKLYADYRKYMGLETPGMPNAGAGTGPNAAQEADYAKFCELMARYETEQAAAVAPAATAPADEAPTAKASEPAVAGAGKETPEEEAAEDAEKKKKAMQFATDEATAKYSELLARVDALEADKVALLDKAEKSDWTQKYSEQRIPAGRIDIADEVKFIMELPTEKRQNYFDRSIKNVAIPSTTPVKNDGIPAASTGSENEATEIKKYYDANRAKYRGDYAKAQRDYRAGSRIEEAKK
jgi:hypothetical protein